MQRLISTSDSIQHVTVSSPYHVQPSINQSCLKLARSRWVVNLQTQTWKQCIQQGQCQSNYLNTYTLLACTSDICLYKEWRIHVYGWISCNWNYNWNYRTWCMPSSIKYWSLTVGGMWFWHCAASCVGVRRLALWRVGRRTSACVRAPHLLPISGQALCLMAGVYKFIMLSSGIRNRVRVRGFFQESVRNRPLTRFWEP